MRFQRLVLVPIAALAALLSLTCDRERSNPLDPQSDFVRQRPATPAGLAAQSGVGLIRLQWQPVADRDLAGYAVYRAEQSTTEYVFVPGDGDSTAQITTGKVSFVDTLDTYGRTYFYRVAAVDTAGLRSELSAFQGATVSADEIGPEAPSSVAALADEDVPGQVVVQWGAPLRDADGGEISGLAGYIVLRAESGTGGVVPIDTVGADVRRYVDTGLRTLTGYLFSVVAFDAAGNVSRLATVVQVTTPGLASPTQVRAQPGSGQIVVTWAGVDDDELQGYNVHRSDRSDGGYVVLSGAEGGTYTTGRTSYVDSSLTGGQVYFYRVQSVGTGGLLSELSAFVGTEAQTDEVGPGSPQNVSAVADEAVLDRIVVRWSAPTADADGGELTGLDRFVVFRSEGGPGAFVPVDTLSWELREYVDEGLKSLTVYAYTVVAYDDAGNESRQATSSQTRTGGIPVPAGLSAAGGTGQIVVSWSGVDDEDLEGYNVYRSNSSDGGYVVLSGAEGGTYTTGLTSYVDSSLATGQVYFYKVQSVGTGSLVSERSGFVGSEARADEVAPGSPRNLSAVPDASDYGRVVLSWGGPLRDADGGELTGLSGYDVFRSEETTDSFVRVAQQVADLSYTDTGLEESSTYWYTVVAVDGEGNESGRASAVRVKTQGEDRVGPGSPQNVSAVADEAVLDRIVVRWSAPTADADGGELTGLDRFVVFRSEGGPGAFVPVDTLSWELREYVDEGLKSLTVYAYTVVAYDDAGNESRQATSSQTRTGGIPVPAGLSAAGGTGQIVVSWSGVDDEDLEGYNVYRSNSSDGGYVVLSGAEGGTYTTGLTSYVDSSLATGQVYFYKVQSVGTGSLVSERSGFVGSEARADEVAPGSPQNMSATVDESAVGRVVVRWSAPVVDANGGELTGLDGFVLLRSEGSSGAYVPLDTLSSEVREYVDEGLKSLTAYAYTVMAFDANHNESARAVPGQVRTPGVASPTGVVASGEINRIGLQWQAVSDDDLVGYNVYRATRPDLAFTRLTGTEGATYTTGQTSFVDSNLTAGQLFYYRVTAVAGELESVPSVFVSGEVRADEVAPAAPADLIAIADQSVASISLSWSAPGQDSDGGDLTGMASYIIFRGDTSPTALAALDTVSVAAASFQDASVDAATTYYYAVSALDPSGNVSGRSATASATTRGIASPRNVAAVGRITKIDVSWTSSSDEDLLGYNVYRSTRSDQGYSRLTGTEGTSFTTGKTVYTDSDLAGGQTLFYRVSVVTSAGESDLSAFDGSTVLTDIRPPGAPINIYGDPVPGDPERLTIHWQSPVTDSDGSELTGVSSYTVYRSATATGIFGLVGTANSTSIEDRELDAKTIYYYQIEATDAAGNVGPRSATAAILSGGVDVPGFVRLTSTTPSDVTEPPIVTITWEKSTGAILRYEVQRTTVADSDDDADYVDILPNSLATTRPDDTASRGQTYYYRVRAVDVEQRPSDWTVPLGVTVSH